MQKLNSIPIIDLFAGPGGLGEGFSSLVKHERNIFDIKLSIEKDENAHKTLELRSFYRYLKKGKIAENYYKVLKESDSSKRNELKRELFNKYPDIYEKVKSETWNAELGTKEFPSPTVDKKIEEVLSGEKNWVLIGGPPCQAYSLAGRSRVGGIDEADHRVYLYKEYIRIIAKHHPAVFVMENVKGLLSAKVNGENVFSWILRDLRNPSSVFPELTSPKYKIFSLTTKHKGFDSSDQPVYDKESDYLIKSELYGIPQKRHRVILLGIREDIDAEPDILKINNKAYTLIEVIGDLPKIRSRLNRSFVSAKILNGRKKRTYVNQVDSDKNWIKVVSQFRNEILTWNGFSDSYKNGELKTFPNGGGSEFVKCKTPSRKNPLYEWFHDKQLGGTCNHESRAHLLQDLRRYMFSSMFANINNRFPRLDEFEKHSLELLPDHLSAKSGKFADRFRVQLPHSPATTVTSHISKDGHYFIHYDPDQCRSLTVREAARIQTFPDNYLICGTRTQQYHQVGNAVPPLLARQIGEIVLKIFIDNQSRENGI